MQISEYDMEFPENLDLEMISKSLFKKGRVAESKSVDSFARRFDSRAISIFAIFGPFRET